MAHRRTWWAVGASVLALAGFAQLPAASASTATGFGSVHGKVWDRATGEPLAGICVTLYDPADYNNSQINVTTGPDGKYVADNVPAGSNLLAMAWDCDGVGPAYVMEHFRNVVGFDGTNPALEPIHVIDGVRTTQINFGLREGASLHVQILSGGQPVPDVVVCPEYVDRDNQNVFCTNTGADGMAHLLGVPRRTKLVAFGGGILTEYFRNADSFDDAKVFFLATGEERNVVMRVERFDVAAARRAAVAPSGPGYEPRFAPAVGG